MSFQTFIDLQDKNEDLFDEICDFSLSIDRYTTTTLTIRKVHDSKTTP